MNQPARQTCPRPVAPWVGVALLSLLVSSSVARGATAEASLASPWIILTAGMDRGNSALVMRAWRIYSNGDCKGAFKLLQPVARRKQAPLSILVLSGTLGKECVDPYAPMHYFEQALKRLGPAADAYPLNLALEIGTIAMEIDSLERAMPFLERAWRHPSYPADDLRVPRLLATAHDVVGKDEIAYWMSVTILLQDPSHRESWLRVERLRQAAGTLADMEKYRDRVPLPAPSPHLLPMLVHGNPGLWTEREAKAAFGDYVALSRELDAQGKKRAALVLRGVVRDAVLGNAISSYRNGHYDGCLRALSTAAKNYPSVELPGFVQAAALELQVSAHLGLGQLAHAMAATERLAALGPIEFLDVKANMKLLLGQIRDKTFAFVSFDPSTGAPRYDDPNDFLGHMMPAISLNHAAESGKSKEASVEAPKGVSYGTVSPAEDRANTLGSLLLLSPSTKSMPDGIPPEEREVIKERFFWWWVRLVLRRIEERNLELPVKLLIASSDSHPDLLRMIRPARGQSVLESMDRIIRGPEGDKIPETTKLAFQTGLWLRDQFRCIKQPINARCEPGSLGAPPAKTGKEQESFMLEMLMRLQQDAHHIDPVICQQRALGLAHRMAHQFEDMLRVDKEPWEEASREPDRSKPYILRYNTRRDDDVRSDCTKQINDNRNQRLAAARETMRMAEGVNLTEVTKDILSGSRIQATSPTVLRKTAWADRLPAEQDIIDGDDAVRAERKMCDAATANTRKRIFSGVLKKADFQKLAKFAGMSPLGARDLPGFRFHFRAMVKSIDRGKDGQPMVTFTAIENDKVVTPACLLASGQEQAIAQLVPWDGGTGAPSIVLVVGSFLGFPPFLQESLFSECVIARMSP